MKKRDRIPHFPAAASAAVMCAASSDVTGFPPSSLNSPGFPPSFDAASRTSYSLYKELPSSMMHFKAWLLRFSKGLDV